MKKQVIRITENELKRIVNESVQTILREYVDSDYEYDGFDHSNAIAEKVINDIYDGLYDDKLDNFMDSDWIFSNLNIDMGEGWKAMQMIKDAATDRKCLIDKDFAFKNGMDSSHVQNRFPSKDWAVTSGNQNRYNLTRDGNTHLDDNIWREHERSDAFGKFPNTFTKKGDVRKNANPNKDLYGTDQFDKRPLHRKNSANRNLMGK